MNVKCNAKINLCLAVKSKRDDGYHILDSVMQSIDLFDTLNIKKADTISVICSKSEFSGEKNIAFSAAKAFFDYTGISGGAEIYIEKGIPDAGGLGGGSSDAAGVILALDKIYNTNLKLDDLIKIGVLVGADVPFCIIGGTARVGGIGEILEPLKPLKDIFFVVAKNGEKPSTKEMYQRLDSIENPMFVDTESFASNLSKNGFSSAAKYIDNSFKAVTGLFSIDEILKDTNSLVICLSGSGPCVFAAYQNESDADKALKILKDRKIEAYKTVPADKGVTIEE
ncbi:MAG: 4-(cytidine 5'-diphospho)-2-C-methyl-D-erythritol kinase [Clostridia bacterium]|nr:4-(cytidine 5'-diphospho)-2-C-methyl-D-erythritol kinase [Clostridia bacterium]